MPNRCPRIVLMNSNSKGLKVEDNEDMSGLKHINVSTKSAIDLRLLACINNVKPLECKTHSNPNKNSIKLCENVNKFYAHIYCKEKLASADIKHHLIVFVEGNIKSKIININTRLKNSKKWLDIVDEKILVHIVNYPLPALGMNVNPYSEYSQKFKIHYADYGVNYSIEFFGSDPINLKINKLK